MDIDAIMPGEIGTFGCFCAINSGQAGQTYYNFFVRGKSNAYVAKIHFWDALEAWWEDVL
jgi:hypothetical protein